jgi:hypothetical protein
MTSEGISWVEGLPLERRADQAILCVRVETIDLLPVRDGGRITHARVAVGDDIGAALGAKFIVLLIGERPGLSAADGIGAYVTYRPQRGLLDSSRNCISNIREGGLSPSKAAGDIIALLRAMRLQGVSGVHLRSPEIPSIGQPEAAT